MAKDKTMQVEKEEVIAAEDTERTRDVCCFAPRADIYEMDDKIVVVVDVPGVDEHSIDIMLEKNVLKINAYIDLSNPDGYSLNFAEYKEGDYSRSFQLSNEIDREKIEATVKDGVLRLYLPKAAEAKVRKINVLSA
jgi:HSP20 family molecular chaperone IbpA